MDMTSIKLVFFVLLFFTTPCSIFSTKLASGSGTDDFICHAVCVTIFDTCHQFCYCLSFLVYVGFCQGIVSLPKVTRCVSHVDCIGEEGSAGYCVRIAGNPHGICSKSKN
ncbi:hypothetical protein Leryth_008312 [Lithospermum erythrorhizon]|nr:hypothetical protein Leryth_008312 [Lithospermum erythrorhizon]